MLIYFKGQELRFWTGEDEFIVLKGIKISGQKHTYTSLFKKERKYPHFNETPFPDWGESYMESRFGSDLWEPLEGTVENIELAMRKSSGDGDTYFTLGTPHMPITGVRYWTLRDNSEYILEIPNDKTGARLSSIEQFDTVLEYFLSWR